MRNRSFTENIKRKLLIVAVLSISGLAILSFFTNRPSGLGVVNGRLAALPESPNGVSSYSTDPAQRLPAIDLESPAGDIIERIAAVIRAMPRSTIIQQSDDYLYAEFRSLIFRFVDDVEFYVDTPAKQIQFRSAARIGHSDLGVNRRRMEKICRQLSDQK